LRRLLQALVVLVVVTILIFVLVRLLPGDPILNYMSQDAYNNADQAQIDEMRKEYGLDKSLPLQYFDWIGGVVRGDMGKSIFYGTTVTEEIGRALPITLYIGLMAWVLAHIIGVAAGVLSAIRRGSGLDTTVTVISNFLIAAPIFWFGVMLIYVFGLKLSWLPIDGYTSPFQDLGLSLRQAIMPVFCLTLFPLAAALRQTRSSMLEVMRQQYIRFAWAKGLSETSVILVHALKNGMIPVITLAGMGITGMFGGAVLVETVFSIPGMGRLAVEAALTQDYAVIQGVVLVITVIVVLTNLLVDISYAWLDPRVRHT
jgi:peptide/nickel transport system permease protein